MGPDCQSRPQFDKNLFLATRTIALCGNVMVLFVMSRISNNNANRRHIFLLRCLTTVDCLALAGMPVMAVVTGAWPIIENSVWLCRQKKLWMSFNLGSGCVVVLMAVDRWLAITRPFFYHQHITKNILKRILIVLWLGVLCLACAPFFGFGVYWDDNSKKCINFYETTKPLDRAHPYLVFSIGVLMCIVTIYSNLAVIITLCSKKRIFKVNDVTADSSNGAFVCIADLTKEERSFIKLSLFLCVLFVVCWLPELIIILLHMHVQDHINMTKINVISTLCLELHFILNPYVYVLHKFIKNRSVRLSWGQKTGNIQKTTPPLPNPA